MLRARAWRRSSNGARVAVDDAKVALAQALDEAPQSEGGGAALAALKARLQAARRDNSAVSPPSHARRTGKGRAQAPGCCRRACALVGRCGDARTRLGSGRSGDRGIAPTAVADEGLPPAARRPPRGQDRRGRTIEGRGGGRGAGRRARQRRSRRRDPSRARSGVGRFIARRSTLRPRDAFEAAMRRDDAAGAARLANARELAALRERAVKVAGIEAECARARADLDAVERWLSSRSTARLRR